MSTAKTGAVLTAIENAWAAKTLDASDATAKHSLSFAFDSAPGTAANLRAALTAPRADGVFEGANDLVANIATFAAMQAIAPALTVAQCRAVGRAFLQDVRDALQTEWASLVPAV